VRKDAGFFVSTGLDLDWTSQLARELGREECGAYGEALGALELWQLSDPFAALYGRRIFSSYHLAVRGARVAGQSLDLQAVAWLGVADEGTLRQLLDVFVPGPFKSRDRVGDTEVTRLDLSFFQVAEKVELAVKEGALRVAIGAHLMERLLRGPGAASPSRELVAAGFEADRFQDLQAPLAWLAGRTGVAERDAETLARLLARFRWFGLSATLEGDAGIHVVGGFELR
jgi:hypothetical protein